MPIDHRKSGENICQSCMDMCFDRMFYENVHKQAKMKRLQRMIAELTVYLHVCATCPEDSKKCEDQQTLRLENENAEDSA